MTLYCDNKRHLVCVPYSVEALHEMAASLGIKRCWFHAGDKPHYDIPKTHIAEITAKCQLVSAREILAIIQGTFRPAVMLVASILPMPSLDPQRYVALYLTNPLLLAAHPGRMRATAEQWAAGGYGQAAAAALAVALYELRERIRLRTATEPRQDEAERVLLDLADHPLFAADRTSLRWNIFASRPSEYAWLRLVLEAALLERAAARDAQHTDPLLLPVARRQRLLDAATVATRATGVPVVLASQLAA